MKKRILIWVMLMMLIVSMIPMAVSAAETPAISLSAASGCAGSTVQVEIVISGNAAPGIVGAELKGRYDASKLEFVSFSNGEIMSGPVCNTKDGSIYVSWEDSLTTGIVGDGVMGTLTFKISGNCAVGDKIRLDLSSFYAFDTDYSDVNFQLIGGEVTVKNHTWSTPAYTWSYDYQTCTASRNQTCGCGGVETETVHSVKTEGSKQITYTASFKNAAFAAQTKTVAAGPVGVTFRLIGATKSEGEYVTWIPTKTYTMEAGSTVYDLIQKALSDAGLGHKMSANYLSRVDAPAVLGGYSLAELDNGPRSGWMFTVNGKHGMLSIGEQVLENRDAIIVHYVNDYVTEQDAFPWLRAADVEPTKPETPSTEPTTPAGSTTPTQPTVAPTQPGTKPNITEPTKPESPSTEPTKPSESTTPTEPVTPSEGTTPTEPVSPSESTAPTEPAPTQPDTTPENTEPTGPAAPSDDPQDPGDDGQCKCLRCRLWWLIFLCGIAVGAAMVWGAPKIMDRLKEYGTKENPAVESPEEAFADEAAEPSTDEMAQAPAEEATQELAEEVSQESTEEAVQEVTDKDDVHEK